MKLLNKLITFHSNNHKSIRNIIHKKKDNLNIISLFHWNLQFYILLENFREGCKIQTYDRLLWSALAAFEQRDLGFCGLSRRSAQFRGLFRQARDNKDLFLSIPPRDTNEIIMHWASYVVYFTRILKNKIQLLFFRLLWAFF